MTISVKLDEVMVRKKCRSKDLAKAIGITEANLSILKSGRAKAIRFSTLEAICKHLNCTPGDILYFTEQSSKSE